MLLSPKYAVKNAEQLRLETTPLELAIRTTPLFRGADDRWRQIHPIRASGSRRIRRNPSGSTQFRKGAA